ncbi:MAG: MFS transporter [Acidobacteriota bacterium]
MKKWLVVALFFGVQVVTDIIRVSLAVVAPVLMELYDISPSAMGYVLSGWNWAYTPSLLLVGPIIDRVGPWLALTVGAGSWSVATLALPLATTAGSLFVLRFLYGAAHSVRFPCQSSAIARWFEPHQRATAVGLCFSGGQAGLAIGAILTAFLLAHWGWQGVYFWIGGGSLLFTLVWLVLYPDKKVGRETAIKQGEPDRTAVKIPWLLLLRHRSIWGMVLGQMGYLYCYFFFVTWLPSYLIMERGMTILETGIVASLPFWMGMLGTLAGGALGDHLIRKGFSTTASRKTMIGVGLTAAMLLMVGAAFATQTWLAVSLLVLCMGCIRLISASANSTPMDLAPPMAVASFTSIQNFIGTMSGLLVAIISGYIKEATGSFTLALLVAGGMALVGALSYVLVVDRFETLSLEPTSDPEQ